MEGRSSGLWDPILTQVDPTREAASKATLPPCELQACEGSAGAVVDWSEPGGALSHRRAVSYLKVLSPGQCGHLGIWPVIYPILRVFRTHWESGLLYQISYFQCFNLKHICGWMWLQFAAPGERFWLLWLCES